MNDSERLKIARYRQEVIRPLAMKVNLGRFDLTIAAIKLECSERTVRRMIESYRNAPILDTLMPGHRTKVPRKSALPAEVIEIMAKVIDWRLRHKRKITAKTLHRMIKRLCRSRALPFPSVRTVQRRLALVSLLQKARAKLIKADPKNLQMYPHKYDVAWPLDVVQIDHTRIDLILNLKELGLGKKRIWLTLAIDVASRMIFGFYLGVKAPSARSGGLAIMMGVLPKRPFVELAGVSYDAFKAHGIADPWPIWGVPMFIDSDNGKDFRSYAFRSGCAQIGVKDVRYRPAGAAHYGGHIERVLGTFMGKVHALPGTTFSNPRERKGYDSVKEGILTLDQFETWLVMSILEYHLTPHSGLDGLTPLQKYSQLQQARPTGCVLVPDKVHVQAAFLPSVPRTVSKHGVRLSNAYYRADELKSLVGRKLVVKYNPANLTEVWICLNGVTPSFAAQRYGKYRDSRYADTLDDPEQSAELKAETERQKDAAEHIANQLGDMIKRLERVKKVQLPARPATTKLPSKPSRKGRPAPIKPKAPKKW